MTPAALLHKGGRPLRAVSVCDNFSRMMTASSMRTSSSRSSAIIFNIFIVPLSPLDRGQKFPIICHPYLWIYPMMIGSE